MKIIFVIVFLLYSFIVTAQKPKKNYEYQDTRKKTESYAKASPEIKADLATFTFAGIDESIAKAQLRKISFTSFGPDFMTFKGEDVNAAGDNIKVTVTTAFFDTAKQKHKLDFDEQYLIRIDRKPYYGNYGSMPKTFIKQLLVIIGKDTVAIPPAAYMDLYNLNFTYADKATQRSVNGVYVSKDKHKIYLYLFCKDATGSYEVTWIIQDKRYVRRVLDYGFM